MSALLMMVPKRWLARLPGRPDSAWSVLGLQAGPGAASVSHLVLSTSVWDASLLLCCSADSRLALHGAAFSTGIPSCRWILCRVNQPAALVYVAAGERVFECCPSCLMGPDQSFAMPQLLQLMLKASLVQEGGTRERTCLHGYGPPGGEAAAPPSPWPLLGSDHALLTQRVSCALNQIAALRIECGAKLFSLHCQCEEDISLQFYFFQKVLSNVLVIHV